MQYLLHSQIYLKKFTVERTVFNYRVYCHSDSCKYSEVAHRLLNEAIGRAYVTTDGQLIVKNK